jgi:hypothetical protein
MTTVTIRDEYGILRLAAHLRGSKLPVTVTIAKGEPRSSAQNRLQHLWCAQIAEQLGDRTAEEVRGLNKLQFGVPVMQESPAFAETYNRIVAPLPYDARLALMMQPLDLPVTRLMTTGQKAAYLDAVQRHWLGQGVALTDPEMMKYAEMMT